jgi:hypothetical protein
MSLLCPRLSIWGYAKICWNIRQKTETKTRERDNSTDAGIAITLSLNRKMLLPQFVATLILAQMKLIQGTCNCQNMAA